MEEIMGIISKIFFSKILVVIALIIIIMLFLKKYKEFQNYKENIENDVTNHKKEEKNKIEQPTNETIENQPEEISNENIEEILEEKVEK
ncbi:hypothetical protein [uncultured Fusobacterium sp.]|uniref:hypothetical protein n=1 Tax=uncultured Fusobacterium sp. TaxID=159267 RepID=UPI00265E6F5C|nr:hypothetical protein [uncultured Fusobacterium sp.]